MNTSNIIEPLGIDNPKEKEEKKKNPVQYYVKFSFMIAYVLLLTTGTITFIEALRTSVPAVRHVMNLETCISIIAGYFYSIFVEKIEEFNKADIPIDWANITLMRYTDWAITTPLMLIALSLVLGQNTNIPIHLPVMVFIILMNYVMLYIGYLGEVGQMVRLTAMILGFIPFIIMFGTIFMTFIKPKYVFANYALFSVFITIWALYGVVYMFNEEYKNIIMNVLDCTAKCFVGLGLWAYYTKIIVL
jgi:bacteriorhodopsin